MSENAVESAAEPEVQQRAEEMGWIPPSRFKGDPERFIDADKFIERGEVVLPIVKAQKKELEVKLAAESARSSRIEAALKEATEALEAIELRHSVATQKAVEQAREEVKRQLSSASAAGDHDAVAELTDQLTQINAKVPDEEGKPKPAAKAEPAPLPPDLIAWNKENPWFGTNKRKTALALGIAQELRDNGEQSTGAAFFEKVKQEMDTELGTKEPPVDKVAGGRHSESEGRSSGGKSYAQLPSDAKAACDADAKRFVGENKKYKSTAEWRSAYASMYFGS